MVGAGAGAGSSPRVAGHLLPARDVPHTAVLSACSLPRAPPPSPRRGASSPAWQAPPIPSPDSQRAAPSFTDQAWPCAGDQSLSRHWCPSALRTPGARARVGVGMGGSPQGGRQQGWGRLCSRGSTRFPAVPTCRFLNILATSFFSPFFQKAKR